MKIDPQNSIIELTRNETAWFYNPDIEVPINELIGAQDFTYRSVRDKVEHFASEIYHATEVTVMIYTEDQDDEIATYAADGLKLLEAVS